MKDNSILLKREDNSGFLNTKRHCYLGKYHKFSVVLLIILLCGSSIGGFAQDGDKHERIKALKVSFITDKLELTPTQAEKFWPIYNTYDSQIHDLRHQEKQLFREKYSRDGVKNELSEAESEKLIKTYNEVRDKRH
ncbi:MAG TPA: hypothetical protein ENH91_11565, partial [Leeuwenhoekiella sp.]|nr:hypothetical protein [Leeuwenhoekiella sp.]